MTAALGLQTCPRRAEGFAWTRDDLRAQERTRLDSWAPPRGGAGLGATVSTCSYCGSMHPDEFMEGLRTRNLAAGPTDKNYKAYVQRPISAAEHAERRAKMIQTIVGSGRSLSHAEEYVDQVAVSLRHDDIAKFYYQHLSSDQMIEFVDLYNRRDDNGSRFMLVGYPGHLHRLPFFMVAGAPNDAV